MKKTLRGLLLSVPLTLLVITWVVHLSTTALRSGIYWAFKKPNYWDLSNEWFQIQAEAEAWYIVWRDGTGWK
jgi:hypothetical protein